MECPNCGLSNPNSAVLCDCTYNFSTKAMHPSTSGNAHRMVTRSFIQDPTKPTQFLLIMLWILLGAEVAMFISDILQLQLVRPGSFSVIAAEANDARQKYVGIFYMCIFIITGISFLRWIYHANVNVRGFGAQGLKFTPGWSIGFYFIPILSLYKPYQAMKEIWQASKNPGDWKSQTIAPIVREWWALYLLSSFASMQSFRLTMAADNVSKLEWATVVSIFSELVGAASVLIAIFLVKAINAMQQAVASQGISKGSQIWEEA